MGKNMLMTFHICNVSFVLLQVGVVLNFHHIRWFLRDFTYFFFGNFERMPSSIFWFKCHVENWWTLSNLKMNLIQSYKIFDSDVSSDIFEHYISSVTLWQMNTWRSSYSLLSRMLLGWMDGILIEILFFFWIHFTACMSINFIVTIYKWHRYHLFKNDEGISKKKYNKSVVFFKMITNFNIDVTWKEFHWNETLACNTQKYK